MSYLLSFNDSLISMFNLHFINFHHLDYSNLDTTVYYMSEYNYFHLISPLKMGFSYRKLITSFYTILEMVTNSYSLM
jgi:hypothetical protein